MKAIGREIVRHDFGASGVMDRPPYSIDEILSNLKIEKLNEMQLASIEANKKHANVILLSSTGSGKTIAFLLPVLQLLNFHISKTQAIVVVPSRELALQIEQVFKSMRTGVKVSSCYGGHLRETEENNLQQAPCLIIGTPGRLADHIRRGNIETENIKTVVLDEFDKSMEQGFQEEISFIVGSLTNLKKRILTSATEANEIPDFIALEELVRLNFLSEENRNGVAIQLLKTNDKDKSETLFKLICFLGNRSTIIFCNHREVVERTSHFLYDKGIINVFYHGALEQPEREVALAKFRNSTSNILVTTDLASRGLDIPNIRYIIHFDLPHTREVFTHRNGRTARMDASGTAILILSPDDTMPVYISPSIEEIKVPEISTLPEKPKWSTLFIGAGKKDKINKVDIVGFLINKGHLKKEDVGLIEVKDFFSFAGVRKVKIGPLLEKIKNEKVKNKKVKITIAK